MQNYVTFTTFNFVVQGEEIFQTLPERASLKTMRISRCWSCDSWTTEIKEFFEDINLEIIIFLYFQDDMENIPEMERTEGSYLIIKFVVPENIHTSPTEGNGNSEGKGEGSKRRQFRKGWGVAP